MTLNTRIKLSIYAVVALSAIMLSACSSSSSSSNEPPATGVGSIGPGGGIVFMTFDDTDSTGLEVFPDSIGEAMWGCEGVVVDAGVVGRARNGIGVPSGALSSEILRDANTTGICFAEAAQLTFEFTNNGFTDWYLPSSDELLKIRDFGFLPGSSADSYWSSTEDSTQNSFVVLIASPGNPLDNGEPSTTIKTEVSNVVAIRFFQR